MTGAFTNSYGAENEQNDTAPDLEFLEFLGQFETDAGEWIDPDSLLTEEFAELLDASTEANTDSETENESVITEDVTTD